MKVCYFGTYDPTFGRNKVLIKGLRQNGVEVMPCNVRAWSSTDEKLTAVRHTYDGVKNVMRLALCYIRLIAKYSTLPRHDVILVGYLGHLDVFVAKLLAILTRRPLVLDAFLSLYETAVEDRQLVSEQSIKARLLRFIDRLSSIICDLVLLDTCTHIQYFVDRLHLPRHKFRRILATADGDDFKPATAEPELSQFRIVYFGQFIPLHGVEHILDAAAILSRRENIRFVLCGTGQTLGEMKARARMLELRNVEFISEWLDSAELGRVIDRCHLCLGVFGNSGKSQRVIPNKVFVGLAKAKPVLSGDSPAMREIFVSDDNIFLCSPGDPAALAQSIEEIQRDEERRLRVALNGHSLYSELLSPEAVGSQLKDILLSGIRGGLRKR